MLCLSLPEKEFIATSVTIWADGISTIICVRIEQ